MMCANKKILYLAVGLSLSVLVVFGRANGEFFGIKSAFGYGGGSVYNPPTPPAGGFSVVINNGGAETNSRVVNLALNGGADSVNMVVSNSVDFRGASQESYQTAKVWILSEGDGEKTVYAKFYNQWGQSSAVVSDTVNLTTLAPAVPLSPLAAKADTNSDGGIDVLDFNILMVNWGAIGAGNVADLSGDGRVDILDFNLLMIYWTI